MWQPPMLDVALDELAGSRAQQVLACHGGLHGGQRHAVLQLVAKTIGTARLIEARACPDAAGQRLIEQPAVQHGVHRTIGRLHLDRAQHSVPVPADLRQNLVQIDLAVLRYERARILRTASLAKEKYDLEAGVWRQHGRSSQCSARIEAGAHLIGERSEEHTSELQSQSNIV